ncbi:hypothetical protein ACOMHN_065074 [Nucella lapillus]
MGSGSQWSDYTATLLDRGLVSRCAIYSLKGQEWAVSHPALRLDRQQFQTIMRGFQDDRELRCVGLQVAQITFTLTRLANRHCLMVGRCSATGSGCIIYRCNRCVVIAIHEESVLPGACFSAVERLGDFLVEKGY